MTSDHSIIKSSRIALFAAFDLQHPTATFRGVALCLAWWTFGVFARAAEPAPTKEQIEKDLALEIELITPKTVLPGERVEVKLALHNRSRDKTYPAATPAGPGYDGRFLNLYFTATVQEGNAAPKPVSNARVWGCGTLSEWEKGAFDLKPGASSQLCPEFLPSTFLEFQESGRVRLVAHYTYGIQKGDFSRIQADPEKGKFAELPYFTLSSPPVEFDVVRSMDIVLKAKAPVQLGANAKLSDLFDLLLVNRTNESKAFQLDLPLSLEIEGIGVLPRIRPRPLQTRRALLDPGGSISLLLGEATAEGLEDQLRMRQLFSDKIKVRACFGEPTNKPYLEDNRAAAYYSKWIEIDVRQPKATRSPK